MGKIGEWFWRFLAVVMLVAVAWMFWIFHQLNPTPLVTSAAYEAAAKAGARQNTQGMIAPPRGSDAASAPAEGQAASAPAEGQAASAPAEAPAARPVSKDPPVDMEKLKLSDSLTAPSKLDKKK